MFSVLPKTDEARTLGKQFLRSGTSIGANNREARRARSTAEFISKIGDCRKELDAPSGARQTMRQHCPEGGRLDKKLDEKLDKKLLGANRAPSCA